MSEIVKNFSSGYFIMSYCTPFLVVINGKPGKYAFDELWDPLFSPDGEKLLIRCIEDGKYYRKVVPVKEI